VRRVVVDGVRWMGPWACGYRRRLCVYSAEFVVVVGVSALGLFRPAGRLRVAGRAVAAGCRPVTSCLVVVLVLPSR